MNRLNSNEDLGVLRNAWMHSAQENVKLNIDEVIL